MAAEAQPVPEHWTAWQMFFEAHAAVCARLEEALQAGHGLSLRWYDVLLQLHASPDGRLTMRDLGRAVVSRRAASPAWSTACSGPGWWSAAATRPTAASST